MFPVRPRLEAGDTLGHISEESRFRLLAVGDDVDAGGDLMLDAISHGLRHPLVVSAGIVTLAAELRLHEIEQFVRPRQAADMRRLDVIAVLLDGHGASFTGLPSPPTAPAMIPSSTFSSRPFTLRTSCRYSFCTMS